MSGVLRKCKEPSFDEYIFCCSCGDHVFEYCSIHGPLLVVPDDKVPSPTGFPPFVPRAALTLPRALLHLAPSPVPESTSASQEETTVEKKRRKKLNSAGIGVFSSVTLPRGVRFGPYRGVKRVRAGSAYYWQIYDRQRVASHVVDAGDAARANWLRYVRCARGVANLAAFQYRGQAYYRTVRVIPPFSELLVFCGSWCARAHGTNAEPSGSLTESEGIEDRKTNDDPEKSINSTTDQPRDVLNHDYEKKGEEEQDKLDASNIQIVSNYSEENSTDECPKVNVNVPQNETYTCDYCNKEFHEKALLISHITGHNTLKDIITITNSSRWICVSCTTKFATKSDFINHDIEDHGSKIKYYACTFCNFKTVDSYGLKRHIQTHSSEKYACNICDAKLSSSNSLKRHVKNHTRGKPYRCKICNAELCDSSSLKRHISIHTGEKPYACEMCHLTFNRSYSLKRHAKTHSGLQTYLCEFCDLTFSQSGLLTRHMRIHRPKECTVCDSKFNTRRALLRHSSIHTGIKPYNCTICSSKFSDNSSLKRHLRTHTDKNCRLALPVTPNVS